jgi:hypothetical protein
MSAQTGPTPSEPAVSVADGECRRFGCTRVLGMVFLMLALVSLGAFGGITFDRLWLARFVPLPNIPPKADASFALMARAWNTIVRYYVDRSAIEPHRMTYGAISGMVYALGDTTLAPHSYAYR